jgi:hypothetical protein
MNIASNWNVTAAVSRRVFPVGSPRLRNEKTDVTLSRNPVFRFHFLTNKLRRIILLSGNLHYLLARARCARGNEMVVVDKNYKEAGRGPGDTLDGFCCDFFPSFARSLTREGHA